jgi:hypothetical protein
MKSAVIGIFALIFLEATSASAGSAGKTAWRVADAVNACLVDCANQEQSCKRLCPATYNTPCIGACDNQAQFCRQNCQRR